MKKIFNRWKKSPPPSPVRLTWNTFFYWDWRLPYIKRRMKKNIFTEALLSDTLMVRYVKFFSQYLQRKKYNYIKRMSISLLWARRFCRKLIRKSAYLAQNNVNDETCDSSCWLKSNSAIYHPGRLIGGLPFLFLKFSNH